jgi:hypothetical protein
MANGGVSSPSLVPQHTNLSRNLRDEVNDAPMTPIVPDGKQPQELASSFFGSEGSAALLVLKTIGDGLAL